MKRLKSFFKYFIFVLILVPCAFIFTACGSSTAEQLAGDLGYSSVEQMLENLKGKDGKDGTNATSLDTYQMWQQAVAKGEFDANKSYLDFLKELNITSDTTSTVANKCVMSVVTVNVSSSSNYYKSGSGVIYSISDEAAYIITNFHVVSTDSLIGRRAYKNYYLTLYGMEGSSQRISASYVGGSLNYDIAVLKVSDSESLKILKYSNAQPATFYEGDVKLGMSVLAIGNPRPAGNDGDPHVEGISVSKGVISVDNELISLLVANKKASIEEIRHDCYIDTGSSGGGLFNMKGELVGITNGGIEGYESLNYAIPSNSVIGVVRNILTHSNEQNDKIKIFTPFTISASEMKSTYNSQTGYVDFNQTISIESVDNSQLTYVGNNKLQNGDVIKHASLTTSSYGEVSMEITRDYHMERLLLNASEGSTLTLTVLRDGQPNALQVKISLTSNIANFLD